MTRAQVLQAELRDETVVLDDAVERVRELSLRLWAVREAHSPVRRRLGGWRCRTCAQPHPCSTLLATGPRDEAAPRRSPS